MKQILLLLYIALCGVLHVNGQNMMGPYMLYDNHYLVDKYIINPAFAGNNYFPKAFLGTQRMELRLHNSPAIHIAGAHTRLGIGSNYSSEYKSNDRSARSAVGGMIFADVNGPYRTMGVKLDYAYHIPLNTRSTTLSFGLGGMLFSKGVRLENYQAVSGNDPLIAESSGNSVVVPDFNAGVVFSHNQLYVGFSVSQLMENSYPFSSFTYTPAKVYRNFYLLAGYRFAYTNFEFEPSLAVGRNLASNHLGNNGNFIDTDIEFFLKPLALIVSYRIDGYISIALSYRTRNLELGVRSELFSTNSSDIRCNGVGLMAAYTFLPSRIRQTKARN